MAFHSKPFGDIRVHYRTYGNGPPLLLVHGLMTSSYSWRYLIESLGQHYTLVIPDLPGHGRTEVSLDRSFRAEDFSIWLGEFQEALGLKGCPTVGNSLGGYIAMRHALETPQAFSALVNIHSPARAEFRYRLLQWGLAVPGTQALLGRWVRGNPEKWAHQNTHYYDETLKSLEEAREYGMPLKSEAGSRTFAKVMSQVLDPNDLEAFGETLSERKRRGLGFPCPLKLLYATEDPLVAPENGKLLKELIPDAELTWLEKTSHFMHVDSPERVAPLLLEFLSGNSPVPVLVPNPGSE